MRERERERERERGGGGLVDDRTTRMRRSGRCASIKTINHQSVAASNLQHPRDLRVRLRELEQQRFVEELVHAHVLAHPLPSSRLHHELPSQVLHRRRLERPQRDRSVERVPRNHRPVIEVRHPERLPLRVIP
eukprot:31141-Pelagococcus_subviridis.AAC.13